MGEAGETPAGTGGLRVEAVGRIFAALGTTEHEAGGEGAGLGEDLPRLEGYTLVRRLGEGGGGAVYLGYREGSGRPLAVKVMGARVGGEGQRSGGLGSGGADRKRAWRELEVMMSLRLACVPRVIDYGVQGGRLFIATEYVEGLRLDEYCTRRGLGRRERVELLAQVADAVQSLHEHGVIHRDIKPSNVLVEEGGGGEGGPARAERSTGGGLRNADCGLGTEGRGGAAATGAAPRSATEVGGTGGTADTNAARGRQVMIIDLGIATLLARDAMETLTADGAPIGSPAFMAPEQARGEREKISTRTDVYGLGATAYVILTGQTPFDCSGTIHEALRRIGSEEPRGARELEPGLAKGLGAVLAKSVAALPQDRYGSASEMAADLRRWLAGESVLAGEAGVWRSGLRWMSRHPVLTTGAASLLVVVSIVCGAALALWWIGLRPASIRMVSTGGLDWIEVRSEAGRTLRKWDAPKGAFGAMVDRPAELGGDRLFVVLTPDLADPFRDQLCGYAARDLRRPEWASGTGPPGIQMPAADWFFAAPKFACTKVQVVDVFNESPGAEIIAIFHDTRWAPSAVRIYDARGTVLFEAWHNGWITGAAWLSEPRVLVLAGVNSEVIWNGRGAIGLRETYPSVVMAIRPEFRKRAGWLATPTAAGDLATDWYKCVLPPNAVDRLMPGGTIGASAASPTTCEVNLLYVTLTIDAKGAETRDRDVNMRYFSPGDMPDPQTFFRLDTLPPLDPERAAAARPANN